MPVEVTPMKNRPSKRGSRANRARSQARISSCMIRLWRSRSFMSGRFRTYSGNGEKRPEAWLELHFSAIYHVSHGKLSLRFVGAYLRDEGDLPIVREYRIGAWKVEQRAGTESVFGGSGLGFREKNGITFFLEFCILPEHLQPTLILDFFFLIVPRRGNLPAHARQISDERDHVELRELGAGIPWTDRLTNREG